MRINKIIIVLLICITLISVLILVIPAHAFRYKGVDFTMLTALTETYADNINLEKENKDFDFITFLSLGLNADYERKRGGLKVSGLINRAYHARFSDTDSSSEFVKLDFTHEFSTYDRLSLRNDFAHTQVPQSFEDEFFRQEGRRDAFENDFQVNYGRNISKRLSIKASYSYLKSLFPDEDSRDTSTNGIGIDVTYSHNFKTNVVLSYNYSRNNFGNSTYNVGIGLRKDVYISKTSYFTGDVRISGNSSDDARLGFNASFVNEIDKISFTRVNLDTTDVLLSEGGDVFDRWQVDGIYSRQLSEVLQGAVQFFYGEGTVSSSGGKDTFVGGSISITYAITEDIRGNLSYSFSHLDSSAPDRGYDRNNVSLRITKAF
jgi:hypothetical protein